MAFVDKVIKPFTPVRLIKKDGEIKVKVVGRTYTISNGELLSSIIANGEELLSAPMRIIGLEDGEEIVWSKRKVFVQSHTNEKAVIIAALESKMFDLNICMTFDYDGYVSCDVQLMTTSFNMAQRLGLEPWPTWKYVCDKFWVEIPMKKEHCNLYHQYPNSAIFSNDETLYEKSSKRASGDLPEQNIHLPFKALLWTGAAERGLGIVSESAENRQPIDEKHYVEIEDAKDSKIIRLRLLDSQPATWNDPRHDATYFFNPIMYNIGFMATPVRPSPKTPILHNAVQTNKTLDELFMPQGKFENYFAFIKSLGYDTIFIHEAWNTIQNFPYLDQETDEKFAKAVELAHEHELKIIPYFGYEISSLAPEFFEYYKKHRTMPNGYKQDPTWWRLPPQRDYAVCYNSDYTDILVEGIRQLVEKYQFDGIYLDGTIYPRSCANQEHGCGYIDRNGELKPTYPIRGVRNIMKQIYAIFEPRGGLVNYHSSTLNFSAMPYTHMGWTGESIQFDLIKAGASDFPVGFAKTEWTGRNFGVAMEMIVYPNPPVWTLEHATGLGLVHSIIPRIAVENADETYNKRASYIAEIKNCFKNFPFEKSTLHAYWDGGVVKCSNESVKCTYYEYVAIDGSTQLLAFCSNLKNAKAENVTIEAEGFERKTLNTIATENADGTFNFNAYEYAIFAFTKK